MKLVPSDTLVIPIDSITINTPEHLGYFMDKESKMEYISHENRHENLIQIYSLDNAQLTKVIKLEREGPNGIGNMGGHHFHNFDSIFIVRHYTNEIYLVDTTATIKNKWVINVEDKGVFIFQTNKMSFFNNRLYLYAFKDTYPHDPEFYVENGLAVILDLRTGQQQKHPVGYPEDYRKGDYFGVSLINVSEVVNNKGELVASFNLDPRLYRYNDQELLGVYDATSKNALLKLQPIADDGDEDYEYYTKIIAESAMYDMLKYDPYREIYYRVLTPAMEHRDPKTEEINLSINKPFFIQILDADLNVIGETSFPQYHFNFREMVVTQKGLMLDNSHLLNPHVNEDEFHFVIFKLQDYED